MKTTEGNKLIAEFMGIPKQDKSNGGGFYLYESPESGEYIDPEDLTYHSSWAWLMPVLEKMLKMDDGHFIDVGCESREAWFNQFFKPEITIPWNAVVEFILEYNTPVMGSFDKNGDTI